MSPSRYLPSRQFSLIAISLIVSLALVYIADRVTTNSTKGTLAVDTQTAAAGHNSLTDWTASLDSVQKDSGVSLPTPPDQNTVDALLQSVQSDNLTQTVSKSLLVNLFAAKGQGLGDDIPTQDKIVTQALTQVPTTPTAKIYAASDLTLSDNSAASLHAYGNAVMSIFITYSDHEYAKTLVIIDAITTQADNGQVDLLIPIQKKYKTIADQLVKVPVPKNLQPFHLQLVNDFANIAATYDGMKSLIGDPLNGVASIQQYRSLTDDAGKMFINIAQALDKNDIIFNKDEPGATWAILLQP
jgi:hypothetical protein